MMLESDVYDKSNLRTTLEGVLYKLRVGCPWRDLPAEFGRWNSVFKRFNEWSVKSKLQNIFKAISADSDHEWSFIDGTIVKVHQHSAGARRECETAIGKSVAENTTKVHMAVDSFGLPIHFEITGGQVHDCKIAPQLVTELIDVEFIVGDKGYDRESLRTQISDQGAIPIIPRKENSKIGNDDMDWCLYKYRHLALNAFARLKHFRSIATRYEKLKRNYEGMVSLGCTIMWLAL
ncbi:MAG: IS5 family transposase [Proteobacteria bacterium]|nr:IS5 family transposase [Pseudomonadota bacterium]